MGVVADMRRRTPEPPPGFPEIQYRPGTAQRLLGELAPLLAEEGIDVDNIDVPDLETLNRALARATERHNMSLFTPVGPARDTAAAALRLVIEALAENNTILAASLLEQVQPESPDNSTATVAACIGLTLGLLDDWLSGAHHTAPTHLRQKTQLPAGHWLGQRAATDILVLAGKGRSFHALHTLITRQGGQQVLYGCALALGATVQAWARITDTPVPELVRDIIR